MKIAMIGHKKVPGRGGGVEVVVEELSRRFAEEGHSVTLYNRWEPGSPKAPREYGGAVIKNIPTFKYPALNAFVYSFLAVFCTLFGKYDVVHIHAEGPGAMTWLTRLLRVPSVVTIHGLDWRRSKWGAFASAYLRQAERAAAKYADEIIVLSESARSYFKDTYGRDTHFIRNGVTAIEPTPPKDILRFGLKEDGYILFVGRLVPEKGIHYLIEAFRPIKTDVKLVIAGAMDKGNKYAEKIRGMAEADPRIIMTGFVSGAALHELYSSCRAFVLPSEVEGMALSLLEALSCGAMCIVSGIMENRGIADKYVTMFVSGDTDDLRRKIEAALSNRRPDCLRREQAEYIRETYSWASAVRETLKLYEKAVKR